MEVFTLVRTHQGPLSPPPYLLCPVCLDNPTVCSRRHRWLCGTRLSGSSISRRRGPLSKMKRARPQKMAGGGGGGDGKMRSSFVRGLSAVFLGRDQQRRRG